MFILHFEAIIEKEYIPNEMLYSIYSIRLYCPRGREGTSNMGGYELRVCLLFRTIMERLAMQDEFTNIDA